MVEITLVDKNDNIIGYKDRSAVTKDDTYRITGLILRNSKGEILLAQRSLNKKNHPGKWGPAVAGTVERDETYESNIVKEAEEEIGLTNFEYKLGPKLFVPEVDRNKFCQIFYATVDKRAEDFRLQEEEVIAVKWMNIDNLKKDISTNPDRYTPALMMEIKNIRS